MMHPSPVLAATLVLLLAACTPPPAAGPLPAPAPQAQAPVEGDSIRAFASEAEIQEFTAGLLREYEAEQARNRPPPPAPERRGWRWPWQRRRPPPPPAVLPPPPPPPAAPMSVATAGVASESVTNVQHAGVDEGGIVKVHGDYLIVLRRGRLFTIRVGDDALQPVSAVDAFGPDISPQSAWYDEILVSGPNVVVIGYSYARGGTELGLFHIAPDGKLTHRATYHMRSGDYYSSRNYASRLVGDKLVFYAPLSVNPRNPSAAFPALRRWGRDSTFRATVDPTRVYRPAGPVPVYGMMLHTVTTCDVAGDDMRCRSTALFGPRGRVFYVSPGAVYVWAVSHARRGDGPSSMLYRMPLDGSTPTGLRVTGAPVDQFSFLESGDHLNVLTRTDAWGESMLGSEFASGRLALLRVPLSELGSGDRTVGSERYRPLPEPLGRGGAFQNRFVGDWLIYGSGAGWNRADTDTLATAYAVPWRGGAASPVQLPHGVDRIEAMGSGAVLIGSDGRDLHFSALRLDDGARLAHRYTRSGASQGETRSHGFFYRPDGADEGILGLPIRGGDRPGYEHLQVGSASILFLRNRAFRLDELGALASGPPTGDDGCRASCVDWYGNARPLFLRGRILALMGYELVEGRVQAGRIREMRRVSFAPPPPTAAIAADWEFEETTGQRAGAHFCQNRGTMTFDRDGDRLGMRYRQTGECTIGSVTSRSDGEGRGRGTVSPASIEFQVDDCRYAGTMNGPDRIVGSIFCGMRMADGTTTEVRGTWNARRLR